MARTGMPTKEKASRISWRQLENDYPEQYQYLLKILTRKPCIHIQKESTEQWSKLKKRIAKIKKADQQDINRVKRWDSRSFNKKKELSGPTEPVFKPTAATNPLTARPHPGMVGDELVANLRNRLAKIE